MHLITMVTFFWDCTFHPFVELRNNPEFLPLLSKDRTHWRRCLLWHGWLPGLTSRIVGTRWAIASSYLASSCLENDFGSYPLSTTSAWHPFWDEDDVQDMVDDVPVAPNIWTDASREPIPHLDVDVAGAGAFVHSPSFIFVNHHWGHAQDLDDSNEGSSHIFSGVLGPVQSVQRAEYWGVIIALQAYSGIHIGIDNLNVLRGVAALLSRNVLRTPLPLVKDGDLLATINSMLCLRGFDTVMVSKVKGHATRAMVNNGDVRFEDLVGNNGADAAADFSMIMSSLLVVIFYGFVDFGTPSFSIFISSWLLFLVSRLIMMVLVALHLMPWYGTKLVSSRLVLHPFV